jgi:hypothetical protein
LEHKLILKEERIIIIFFICLIDFLSNKRKKIQFNCVEKKYIKRFFLLRLERFWEKIIYKFINNDTNKDK